MNQESTWSAPATPSVHVLQRVEAAGSIGAQALEQGELLKTVTHWPIDGIKLNTVVE